jgi:hypothetical protein
MEDILEVILEVILQVILEVIKTSILNIMIYMENHIGLNLNHCSHFLNLSTLEMGLESDLAKKNNFCCVIS